MKFEIGLRLLIFLINYCRMHMAPHCMTMTSPVAKEGKNITKPNKPCRKMIKQNQRYFSSQNHNTYLCNSDNLFRILNETKYAFVLVDYYTWYKIEIINYRTSNYCNWSVEFKNLNFNYVILTKHNVTFPQDPVLKSQYISIWNH